MLLGERFVFVENPKTASTSIQNALSEHGETVLSKHDNLMSYRIAPNRRWRVWCVRNPYDRIVSGYHHHTRSPKKAGRAYPSFDQWVLGDPWITGPGTDFKRTSQMFWGHKCNLVLRFENLEEDFHNACVKIGLPKIDLPILNATKSRGSYREYFTSRSQRAVEDRFRWEIETYGYEF